LYPVLEKVGVGSTGLKMEQTYSGWVISFRFLRPRIHIEKMIENCPIKIGRG